jgi:hypothetical protein
MWPASHRAIETNRTESRLTTSPKHVARRKRAWLEAATDGELGIGWQLTFSHALL